MTTKSSEDAVAKQGLGEELLDLLVCPRDHRPLRLDGAVLVCTVCGHRYPIEDGIPNMVIDERS